jgi:hypothetical protein
MKVTLEYADTLLGPAIYVIEQDGTQFGRRLATFFGPKRGLRRRAMTFLKDKYPKGVEVCDG